jgi:hypothetical protein
MIAGIAVIARNRRNRKNNLITDPWGRLAGDLLFEAYKKRPF